MPLYEYQCGTCKTIIEAIRSVEERENGPECCNQPMGKLLPRRISTPAFAGSAAAEIAADKQIQLLEECQSEGMPTQTEMEVGIAQGIARADRLGVDPERIVGPAIKEMSTAKSTDEAAFIGALD